MDVILAFLNNEVYVVSSDALEGPDSQVEPLVLANSSGKPVLAVFSHPSRVTEQYLEAAPTCWARRAPRSSATSATSSAW